MTEQRNEISRVTRSVDDSIIAGVCGGLGEQFGVSAWWFRWAFIILTLFGFAGIFFYIIAWVLIPKETEDDSVATSWMEGLDLSDVGTIFGVVLIGVAGVIILNQFFRVSGALVAAGVLAVVGVLLYRGDLRPPDRPQGGGPHYTDEDEPVPDAEPASRDADAPAPADTPLAGASVASAVATKPPKAKKPPKVKKPKPPPSMLGRLTMAVLLIALSAMALVELSGWARFQPVEYLAVGMGIIAVGLLVGAWIGRARWLIIIGILLAPWLFFASLLPNVAEWTIGDPSYAPASVQQVQDSYSLGVGQLTIDLSRLTPEELAEVGTIEASVSLGELFVVLPLGAGTVVKADVGAGSVEIGVRFHEVYGAPPEVRFDAFEECLAYGFGDDECEDRFLNGNSLNDIEIDYGEYGWQEWRSDSGVGMSKSYDLGVPPRDFVLDLKVGTGRINIQQLGKYYADDQNEG